MKATQELLESRQRTCHICKHEGTLCDTRKGEIVSHDEVYKVDEMQILVADFSGEAICEYCIDDEDYPA
jgi:hypothetical protein